MNQWLLLMKNKKFYLPALIVVLFFYNNTQQQHLQESIQDLTWIALHEAPYRAQKKMPSPHEMPLLELSKLQETLKDPDMTNFSARIDVARENHFTVEMASIPYESFSVWVSKLQQKYKFKVEQLDIERLKEPGTVHARISFSPM